MEIKKYKSFREELIIEKVVNESTVYYSPNFRNRLMLIDDEVARELLSIEGLDISPDVTLIDNFDDNNGHISFMTKQSALDKIKNNTGSEYEFFDDFDKSKADNFYNSDYGNIYSSKRNHFKVSKFINRAFPGKFTQKEIENFMNKFKAQITNENQEFKLVSGDDIYKWYDRDSHSIEDKVSTLGKSCMVNKGDEVFEIYAKNPDKCQLLILTENDKLVARALVFHINSVKDKEGVEIDEIETYMDRQYYFVDSDVEKLRRCANDKGWAYRATNTEGDKETITYQGKTFEAEMMIELKGQYEKYPYMDTFCYYDKDSEELYNYENGDLIILNDTDGGYEDPNEIKIYSEYHDEMIDELDAVKLADGGGFVKREVANFIPNHGWYLPSSADIVETYDGNTRHFEDTVYCEASDYFIDLGKEVHVITNLEDEYSDYFHQDDDGEFGLYEDIDNIDEIKEKYPNVDWDNYQGISKQII